ncbi:hypothetical protein JCM33374_g1277 [Metschnikowia sp. JCM 33374]|nr:hypothetical protein JCM33374_g1277 [Metschnikowia sp. JCM 33374]
MSSSHSSFQNNDQNFFQNSHTCPTRPHVPYTTSYTDHRNGTENIGLQIPPLNKLPQYSGPATPLSASHPGHPRHLPHDINVPKVPGIDHLLDMYSHLRHFPNAGRTSVPSRENSIPSQYPIKNQLDISNHGSSSDLRGYTENMVHLSNWAPPENRTPPKTMSLNQISQSPTIRVPGLSQLDLCQRGPLPHSFSFPETSTIPSRQPLVHCGPTYLQQDQETYNADLASVNFLSSPSAVEVVSERKNPEDGEDESSNPSLSLEKVSSRNLYGVLVSFLRKYHQHIPLDDFYNLLYSETPPEFETTRTSGSPDVTAGPSSDLRVEGLKEFQVILNRLHTPRTGFASFTSTKELPLSAANMHELLRNFLAIKIIFSALKKVEEPSFSRTTVLRTTIYKAYYILCHKLIQKYPGISIHSGARQSLVLGQSRLGQLTNIIFPRIVAKRLGKRGQSKSQYIGYTLDENILDENIRGLLELDIAQLKAKFQKTTDITSQKRRQGMVTAGAKVTFPNRPLFADSPRPSNEIFPAQNPLKSYIDPSYTYPDLDFSPRVWTSLPGSIPQQSNWAKENMERSLMVLQAYNIDLGPLQTVFKAGIFTEDNLNALPKSMVGAIRALLNESAPTEAYMHLYHVVLLLLFPLVIAGNEEVPVVSKAYLRTSVKNAVDKLESKFANVEQIDDTSFCIFTHLLRKMIYLNELTSFEVHPYYTEGVVKEMVRDIESEADCEMDYLSSKSALEETFIRGVVTSMCAYNFKLMPDESTASQKTPIETITNIAKKLHNSAMIVKEATRRNYGEAKSKGLGFMAQDVSYQVFKVASEEFHKYARERTISVLPITLIIFVMSHYNNTIQHAAFHGFEKRDPVLTQETFKTWCAVSKMFQEYICVISEVYALGEKLSSV